jgi:hypothetical protein
MSLNFILFGVALAWVLYLFNVTTPGVSMLLLMHLEAIIEQKGITLVTQANALLRSRVKSLSGLFLW